MMSQAKRLPDARFLDPIRAEGPDGTIGEGLVELHLDHPDYAAWTKFLGVHELGQGAGIHVQPAGA
jgi:hypothetical protein